MLNCSLSEGFGDLNLTEIDFGCCTALDLGVIFDVIFKFEGLTKLRLAGLKMESLPERKPFTTFEPLNLIPLSEGFGELDLKELDLWWACDSLTMDVEINKIVEMKNLTKLVIGGTKISVLPERFGQLGNLRELNMEACKSLLSLPDSFCNLSSLIKLDLGDNHGGCEKLASLPERFGELNLTEIDFSCCKQLDLGVIFDVIFKFEGLTKLGLAGLNMESLPERKL